jgi:hypothetical protein
VIDVPVPASLRIVGYERARPRLRIEHNETVSIGPGVVSSVFYKSLTDIANVLFASVERDMNVTRVAALALFGDKNISGIAEA